MPVQFLNAFFFRMAILASFNLIYYSFKWEYLCTLLGNCLAWMFRYFNDIETFFVYPGFSGALAGVSTIGRSCLYIELFAYVFPFLYDTKKSFFYNVMVIIWVAVLILTINFFRIYLCIIWRINYDVSRWLNHDLPDTLIWYPVCIALMIYGALHSEPISMKFVKKA